MTPVVKRTIIVAGVALAGATPELMSFLGLWEGEGQFVVYADGLAGGLPTVCRGLTRHVTATPIVVGERWSARKCEREEAAAVERVQLALAPCFVVAPPQQVFDAATSHAWNLGVTSTCSSGAMKAWNRGEWDRGCQRISRGDDGTLVWAYVRTGKTLPNGKPEMRFVQGLANRRAAETKLCGG